MSDAPTPPQPATPYSTTAQGPTAAPSVPPYARGYARQPYPGAPPVWTAPPPSGGSRVLAGLALGLAIFGAVVSFIPFGIVFSWLFLLAAIVLAIVALVRRAAGKGMSIAALVVSGVGILVAVLWGVGFAMFGSWIEGIDGSGPDPDYGDEQYEDHSYPSLGVDDSSAGLSRSDALPYGTPITVVDESTGEDVWEITVDAPVDATSAAVGEAPLNGAYVAVPVELTNRTADDISVSDQYEYAPYSFLLTGDGGRAEPGYLPGPPDYPLLWDLDAIGTGDTVTYYESFDVAASVVDTGYFVLDLDSGEQVFWGP